MKTTNLTFMEAVSALCAGYRIGIRDTEAEREVELKHERGGVLYWHILEKIQPDEDSISEPHHISTWDVMDSRYYIIDPIPEIDIKITGDKIDNIKRLKMDWAAQESKVAEDAKFIDEFNKQIGYVGASANKVG